MFVKKKKQRSKEEVQNFGPSWNISTIIGQIVRIFCKGIHGSQRMILTDLGEPLTHPLAPPWGLYLSEMYSPQAMKVI